MKRLRWQILIVVLALIAIGVLLLSQQPVLQEINPIQPTSGGIYSEALIGAFGRLSPVLDYFNQADHDIDRLLYSGLIKFNDYGLPEGDLVESWGISADGKVYNFSIRNNATWHDGQPVTSDDVIFTTNLMHNDAIPLPDDIKALWKQVEVKALDQKTLQFRLPEPFAPFLDYLSFGVLPKHLLGDTDAAHLVNAQFNLQPVGSGPYRFDHLTAENGQITTVVLSAYDKYHFGRPYIDQVVFRYYPDATAALVGYRKEDVLGIGQISENILGESLKEPALDVYTGRLPDLTLIFLNLNDPKLPFFHDPNIRHALQAGLNRQWIVDRLLNGQAVIADGPIFPGTWAYYENIEHIEYNSAKATALIKAGGYTIPAEGGVVRTKEGVALSFDLAYPDEPRYQPLAEAIQKDWSKLGMQVNLKPVSLDELLSGYLEPHTYQAALVTLSLAGSPDPDPYPFWDQAQITDGQNYSQWNDRQASEFLERARVTVDTSERAKLYRNFQVRFSTDLPALPLFYPVYTYGVNDQVQNVRIGSFFDPSDRFNTLPSWYLVVKRPLGTQELATPTP